MICHFTELAENEVLVKVPILMSIIKMHWAMSESGQVIRTYPMTPGIDLSELSSKVTIHVFSKERSCTCYWFWAWCHLSRRLQPIPKVPGDWLVPLPKNMTLRQAMIFGTAGFTAMLCVNALIRQGMTSDKKVVRLTWCFWRCRQYSGSPVT